MYLCRGNAREYSSRSVFFFFSSRRRHTRCSRDWSSDVCSSDLRFKEDSRELAIARPEFFACPRPSEASLRKQLTSSRKARYELAKRVCKKEADRGAGSRIGPVRDAGLHRSEERRVGKECRSRWS